MASTISLIILVGEELVKVISWATQKWKAKSRKPLHYAELLDFHTRFYGYLQYVKKTMLDVDAIAFTPKSLETLLNDLEEFVPLVKDQLSDIKRCTKEDIRHLRELVMGTFQCGMARAQLEVLMKAYAEIKAVRSALTENQEMVAKKHGGLHITISGEQACSNLGMRKFLSFVQNMPYPAETFRERFRRELDIVHGHPHATQASKVNKPDAGVVEELERLGRLSMRGHDVEKDEGKEEEEEDKTREDLSSRETMEKQGRRATTQEDCGGRENPNRNMELCVQEGKCAVRVSKPKGRQLFELVYEGSDASMGMVIGKRPMELSKELGCFYFEVKLVEMAELSEGQESGLFGVGVGLARSDKFRDNKMAGKYSRSCGYDGRVGEVYCNNSVQGTCSMGYLANGDTLGIGILRQQTAQSLIFFVKNGVLKLCIQLDHSLRKSSSSSQGLLPVISFVSTNVRLCVDFCGPFHLSELVRQAKASIT